MHVNIPQNNINQDTYLTRFSDLGLWWICIAKVAVKNIKNPIDRMPLRITFGKITGALMEIKGRIRKVKISQSVFMEMSNQQDKTFFPLLNKL